MTLRQSKGTCATCEYFKPDPRAERWRLLLDWDGWCKNMGATLGARDIVVHKTATCNHYNRGVKDDETRKSNAT